MFLPQSFVSLPKIYVGLRKKQNKIATSAGGPPVTSFSEVGFSKFDIWTLKNTQNGAKNLENRLNLGKIDLLT